MMKLLIAAPPDQMVSARRFETEFGAPLVEIGVRKFPDGESLVRAPAAAGTVIVYCALDRPNEKLVELGLAASAFRDLGVNRLVLAAPYLCYMRQDMAFNEGEAVAQRVIGGLLAKWFDRIVTVEPHLHRTKSLMQVFPGIESDALTAAGLLADIIRSDNPCPETLVIGPDAESESWTTSVATAARAPFIILKKTRSGDRKVAIAATAEDVIAGKHVYLVDDIISTGATVAAAARFLKMNGADRIDVLAVHALFNKEDDRIMLDAGVSSIRSTDTVAHWTNAVSIAPLLAAALDGERAK